MRQRLAPMLFDDTDKDIAEAERKSVVAQAPRSKAAVKKQTTGLNALLAETGRVRSLTDFKWARPVKA